MNIKKIIIIILSGLIILSFAGCGQTDTGNIDTGNIDTGNINVIIN